mmetsp:Transcript_1466/g.3979  ORF Transcript_1466/g.3979 Transcript_1466/m.3979 type:complete len:323 (-) Transcript_1466:2-970(-)
MMGTQYLETTRCSIKQSISLHFRWPWRKMITDSATLFPSSDTRFSLISSNRAAATSKTRNSALTVMDKFAKRRIVFPRSRSDTSAFLTIWRHTGCTNGMSRMWLEGHDALTFTHNRIADSRRGKCSRANTLKMWLKRAMTRSKTCNTACAPTSEKKVKSARKAMAARATSELATSTTRTAVFTSPVSSARSTKTRLASAFSFSGCNSIHSCSKALPKRTPSAEAKAISAPSAPSAIPPKISSTKARRLHTSGGSPSEDGIEIGLALAHASTRRATVSPPAGTQPCRAARWPTPVTSGRAVRGCHAKTWPLAFPRGRCSSQQT